MVKNNKGITLLELLISIALTSIVIVFLFRLLVDIRVTYVNNNFNKNNQQKRALIIKTVETDFITNGLIGLKDEGSTKDKLRITFTFSNDKTSLLEVDSKSISYVNADNNKEIWKMEDDDYTYNQSCAKYKMFSTDNYYYLKISITVNKGELDNNYFDDIEFNYIGGTVPKENFKAASTLGVC